jgi:hypothetical protein
MHLIPSTAVSSFVLYFLGDCSYRHIFILPYFYGLFVQIKLHS